MGCWKGFESGGVDFCTLSSHGAFSMEAFREGDPDVSGSGLGTFEGDVEVGEPTVVLNKPWGWWWCVGALSLDLPDSSVEVGDGVLLVGVFSPEVGNNLFIILDSLCEGAGNVLGCFSEVFSGSSRSKDLEDGEPRARRRRVWEGDFSFINGWWDWGRFWRRVEGVYFFRVDFDGDVRGSGANDGQGGSS